jgi:hypothetical protein
MYQLKVSLNGIRPPVWRRLLVPSSVRLPDLHDILQISMGWLDAHLHQFSCGSVCFGQPDPDFPDSVADETGVRLETVLAAEGESLLYEYDFGDGWEHKVTLEKMLPYERGRGGVRCIGGRRSCPPEDVGGIYGYTEFLQAYADAAHPRHKEMRRWAGPDFDPNDFAVERINVLLHQRRASA